MHPCKTVHQRPHAGLRCLTHAQYWSEGGCDLGTCRAQAITRAIEAQDRLVEEAKTGIVETALGTNEY